MNTRDHALLVGIDHYPRLKRSLKGAINDVNHFRRWLVDPRGADVPERNIRQITSTIDPADPNSAIPTNAAIDDIFVDLLNMSRDRWGRMGRRIYMFFAGHGFARSSDAVCILTPNARRELYAHIPAHHYAQLAREAGGFEQICLFADSCREVFENAPASINPPFVFERRALPCDVVRGYAAGWSGLTEEGAFEGEMRGAFTYALLQALSVGKISAHQLQEFTSINLSTLLNRPRNQFFSIEVNSGAFNFNEAAAAPAVELSVHPTPNLSRINFQLQDARGVDVLNVALSDIPLQRRIPPGLYKVSIGGGPPSILRIEPVARKVIRI